MKIALIGCGKAKLSHAAPASELYTSTLFRLSLQYAQQERADVYVLSAKYGLIAADTVIEPYEASLIGLSRAERQAWAVRVAEQIRTQLPADARLVLLAGSFYTGFLGQIPQTVELPLDGLTLFQRLSWLSRHVERQVATCRQCSRPLYDRNDCGLCRKCNAPHAARVSLQAKTPAIAARLRFLRGLLPATGIEIGEARPDWWGEGSKGRQLRITDLRRLNARRSPDGTWSIPQQAAA